MSSALNLSPVALNAAANKLVKEELRVGNILIFVSFIKIMISILLILDLHHLNYCWYLFQHPGSLPSNYVKRKTTAPFTVIMPTRHCYSDILEEDYHMEW